MAEASPVAASFYVCGMLIFGSVNTITTKIQFTLSSTGYDLKRGKHKFEKPWLSTFIMFVGMASALCIHQFFAIVRFKSRGSLSVPLRGSSPGDIEACDHDADNKVSNKKKILLTAIPSIFDLLATGFCSLGMLYIPASVWQMLRGAEIVFAAFFTVICLQKQMQIFNYFGLFICVVGVTCVGASNILGGKASSSGQSNELSRSQGDVLVGMGMVILGQVVQAAQVVAEEWLLKDVDLADIKIIGYEGIWGILAMILIVFPMFLFLPGTDNGCQEDPVDALYMIWNNTNLQLVILIFLLSCATYNVAGIAVTGALSAVHRTILEASRTCIIWIFGLVVHSYDETSPFGEMLTPYSWLQLFGFVVLLVGQAVYGEILKLPFLTYSSRGPASE
eukprot:TRINITY_DN7945_c0_g1_i2.p1 TRINITY_DN7945_c0_g1~~TRINITY_DN7945_c0_g1_i2.p1  ORF type:complete len:391 (-),score=51.13 TRINITY_DN7945_c0_g1_i2:547-1719(-)